jgi:hypothetical protein
LNRQGAKKYRNKTQIKSNRQARQEIQEPNGLPSTINEIVKDYPPYISLLV